MDYLPLDTDLTVPAGEFFVRVPLVLIDDAEVEPDETVELQLTAGNTSFADPAFSTLTATIVDNESTLSLGSPQVDEPDGVTSFVTGVSPSATLDRAGPSVDVCLVRDTAATTASEPADYTALNRGIPQPNCDATLIVFSGETTSTTRDILLVRSDTLVEPDETVVYRPRWVTGAHLDPAAAAFRLTIKDAGTVVTIADADGDLVDDGIDVDSGAGTATPGLFARGTTTGRLLTTAGLAPKVLSTNAFPSGVRVAVPPGTGGPVTLRICTFTVELTAGSDAGFNCGSVIADVTKGSVRLPLSATTSVTIPAGVKAEVAQTGADAWTVDVLADTTTGGTGATVTSNGTTSNVKVDDPVTPVTAWTFTGFKGLSATTQNRIKAGSGVEFAFTVKTSTGTAVRTLTTTPYARTAPCGTPSPTPTTTSGPTRTVSSANGSYDLEWKTPKTLAGRCGVLGLTIGDGRTHEIPVRFT